MNPLALLSEVDWRPLLYLLLGLILSGLVLSALLTMLSPLARFSCNTLTSILFPTPTCVYPKISQKLYPKVAQMNSAAALRIR